MNQKALLKPLESCKVILWTSLLLGRRHAEVPEKDKELKYCSETFSCTWTVPWQWAEECWRFLPSDQQQWSSSAAPFRIWASMVLSFPTSKRIKSLGLDRTWTHDKWCALLSGLIHTPTYQAIIPNLATLHPSLKRVCLRQGLASGCP